MQATNSLVRPSDHTNRASSIISDGQEQLSAARYRFRLEGMRMIGMLVSSPVLGGSESSLRTFDSALRAELTIWDSLSDEALLDFEDTIV